MKHLIHFCLITAALFLTVLVSCEKDPGEFRQGPPRILDKPIVADNYYPRNGGAASKIIIEGNNFGNKVEDLRVWFNDKKGAVVGTSGNRLYVIAPKRPGEGDTIQCKITIAAGEGREFGKDSILVDGDFRYVVSRLVTTVASKPNNSDDGLVYEGTLAEVVYRWTNTLILDAQDNIFMYQSWPVRFIQLNEEGNWSRLLYTAGQSGEANWIKYGQPAFDKITEQIYLPSNGNRDLALVGAYYEFDPENQWMPRIRNFIHPSLEQQAEGMQDWSISIKSAMCLDQDGNIWTIDNLTGTVIKVDRFTRIGESVGVIPLTSDQTENNGLHMLFHPEKPTELYITFYAPLSRIGIYHTDTGEFETIVGQSAVAGFRDGPRSDAQINSPGQFVFESDGGMIFSDAENHCIRRLSPDVIDPETGELIEGTITTVVGWPMQPGYQDGNPADARFRVPIGLAISPITGDIYIADNGNQTIRKMSIQ